MEKFSLCAAPWSGTGRKSATERQLGYGAAKIGPESEEVETIEEGAREVNVSAGSA